MTRRALMQRVVEAHAVGRPAALCVMVPTRSSALRRPVRWSCWTKPRTSAARSTAATTPTDYAWIPARVVQDGGQSVTPATYSDW